MVQAKVLLVEDDELLREVYTENLKDAGIIVETAVDGEEAFAKMSKGGWDLILLDIILPKLDGFSVMQKIAANPPQQINKRIIFLTNLDDPAEIKKAKEVGNGYIIKSQVTPDAFVAEVKKYLAS